MENLHIKKQILISLCTDEADVITFTTDIGRYNCVKNIPEDYTYNCSSIRVMSDAEIEMLESFSNIIFIIIWIIIITKLVQTYGPKE